MDQKNGSGAIFKNTKKTKDTHPDYQGKIKDLNGKEWSLSLWIKKPEGKQAYFSVAVQEPYVSQTTKPSPSQTDDLPF